MTTITKPEMRAERDDLLRALRATRSRLRALSPDFDRLLGDDANPQSVAQSIEQLILRVEAATEHIDSQKRTPKIVERRHGVAVELAHRVSRVLEDHDVMQGQTLNVLVQIGDDIGLHLASKTWRRVLRMAHAGGPHQRAP